jgi:putative oxidoreductase
MIRTLTSWLESHGRDGAALLLRLGVSSFMIVNHGWPKLMKFPEKHMTFSDPLGVSPSVSMALAIFGELVCPALIALGLGTRFAALPAIFTMLVAAVVVHSDAIFTKGEAALMYALAFGAILLLGAGRFSVDALLKRRGLGG